MGEELRVASPTSFRRFVWMNVDVDDHSAVPIQGRVVSSSQRVAWDRLWHLLLGASGNHASQGIPELRLSANGKR